MSSSSGNSEFLLTTKNIIQDRMSDEHFGVSELADAVNMSRSNLLRKLKKQTGKSASQYIRKIRLDKAKELLEDSEMTISEISYEIGFSNSSYFIKCFREEFGFPPGESRKLTEEELEKKTDTDNFTIEEDENEKDHIVSKIDEESSALKASAPSFFSRYQN
ncbi:MAG: helix-turn-helix transcriptional regulator, partial [Kangiellaceae bacterium]|nr:helix-turn-helix transcriptional regulator [Kangiellaceae bacterium]